MDNSFYREEILQHFRFPKNNFKPIVFNRQAALDNPLCGDEITVYLQVKKQQVVGINYLIKGCAIAVYSASFLSETWRHQEIQTILTASSNRVLNLLKLKLTSTRAKCALLPFLAIKKALL